MAAGQGVRHGERDRRHAGVDGPAVALAAGAQQARRRARGRRPRAPSRRAARARPSRRRTRARRRRAAAAAARPHPDRAPRAQRVDHGIARGPRAPRARRVPPATQVPARAGRSRQAAAQNARQGGRRGGGASRSALAPQPLDPLRQPPRSRCARLAAAPVELAHAGTPGRPHHLGDRLAPRASRPAAAPGARSGRARSPPARAPPRAAARRPPSAPASRPAAARPRGEFACTVVSEPSWPVFSACSMSSASAPRTSPTTIRSGRIRSALRTSWRIVTSPRPSRFAGRASSRTTCRWRSRSSAASSIVTIRSSPGIAPDSAFSVVVLPDPVPPLTRIDARAATLTASSSASAAGSVPLRHQLPQREPLAPEAPDRQARPRQRQRRDHHVHARAVGQPRVAQRRRLVHPPPQRRQDRARSRASARPRPAKLHAGPLDPPAPLHVDRAAARSPSPRRPPGRASSGSSGPSPVASTHHSLASAPRARPRGSAAASRSTSARTSCSSEPPASPVTRALDQPRTQRLGQLVQRVHLGGEGRRAARLAPRGADRGARTSARVPRELEAVLVGPFTQRMPLR